MSKEIGRNDPCPCGSGKKFKNCCLNKPNDNTDTQHIVAIYQLIIFKFFSEGHIDLMGELLKCQELIYKRVETIGINVSENANDYLKQYLNECEKLAQQIGEQYSVYELLYWSRRFGPKNIFEVSDLSVMLYREIQSLLIYKYGNPIENVYKDESDSVYPDYLIPYSDKDYTKTAKKIQGENLPERIVNVLVATLRLEVLAFVYLRATQVYRIINKGGTIRIQKQSYSLYTDTNEELDFLLKIYDDRAQKGNFFSVTGTYVEPRDLSFSEQNPFPFPLFELNVDHKLKIPLHIFKTESYKEVLPNDKYEIESNYILITYDIVGVKNFLSEFDSEFEKFYGFTVAEFILFLCYVSYKVGSNFSKSISAQISVLNRAYTIAEYDLESYADSFLQLAPTIFEKVFGKKLDFKPNIQKILKRFLLTVDNKRDIDVWTRGPKRFLYQVSVKDMVVDYTGISDIVAYIVKEITSRDGDVGNRRAVHFENAIVKELSSHIDKRNVWVCRKDISANGERREIDASFIIEDVLVIMEAKAVNVSFAFDKGDKNAIEFRKAKMKQAIKEANEKAEFIKNNFSDINPKLNKAIRFICPIVISSYPEYIWEKSEELFITSTFTLHRIITVEEIATLIKTPVEELRNKSWVVKL